MSKHPPFYYFFCNHWTQGGIGYAFRTGWHRGRRYQETFSAVYTIDKMLDAADQYPGLKVAFELDAHLYEEVLKEAPQTIERLKAYLSAGKASIEGGTYSQPFGQDYGWEPNLRQLTYGRRAIREVLGVEARGFLVEEQWFHPQMPQLLTGSGFTCASLQNQNSGRVKPMPDAVIRWVGIDGSRIPTIPSNDLMVSCVRQYQGYDEYRELLARYEAPLLTQWVEVWAPGYDWGGSCTPFEKAIHQAFDMGAECVGLQEYVDRVLPDLSVRDVYIALDESNYFNAWYQGGGWGSDGDQVIVKDKLAEQRLLTLESLSALAGLRGAPALSDGQLQGLWKRLFVLQNHDFSGARTYRTVYKGVVTTAGEMGKAAYDELCADAEGLAGQVLAGVAPASERSVTLFTATGVPGPRPVVLPVGPEAEVLQEGRPVPQQPTADGRVVAVVDLPSVGTARLETVSRPAPEQEPQPLPAEPIVDDGAYRMEWVTEKRHLAITEKATGLTVELEPFTGPVGHLNEHNQQFPSLNPGYKFYAFYMSGHISAPDWLPPVQVRVEEAGPVRSTLVLRQDLVTFHTTEAVAAFAECRVSLYHGTGRVTVDSYLYAGVPVGLRCEAVFRHNLPGARYFRDFAFGEEETGVDDSYTNTYYRVLGERGGFTLIHGGTQRARIERRPDGGTIANLMARDACLGEYRWSWALCFGRHQPHESARLVRVHHGWTAAALGADPQPADLVCLSDDRLVLSAVYTEGNRTFVRAVNYSPEPFAAELRLGLPFTKAELTDLEGNPVAPAALSGGAVHLEARPWQILTIALER